VRGIAPYLETRVKSRDSRSTGRGVTSPVADEDFDVAWLHCRVTLASHSDEGEPRGLPVYAYQFADQTAPYYFPKMPGFVPLAAHTTDIQYLFPLYHGGPTGIPHQLNNKQEQLSDELVAAWTNFAWTGNPNGQGKMPWPLYNPNKPNVASILSENIPTLSTITDAVFVAEHKCNFWDKILTF
jgi:carboxylesterase type B